MNILSENIGFDSEGYRTGSFMAGPMFGKYSGKWDFKELEWGADNEISSSCTERLGVGTSDAMVRFNFVKYNTLIFKDALISAPIDVTVEVINKLPKSLGDKLFRLALGVNSVSKKEQTDFLKMSKPDVTATE